MLVDIKCGRLHPDVESILTRPHLFLPLSARSLNFLNQVLKRDLEIEDLVDQLGVLRIKQEICIQIILLVEAAHYLLQPDMPHDEEEPVTDNQLALPLQRRLVGEVLRDVSDWPSMRPILLQVFQEELTSHTLEEVLQIVQDVCVQSKLDRRHFDAHASDYASFTSLQLILLLLVAVQLGVAIDFVHDELVLSFALLGERLHHHVVQLLGIHGFENLVLHLAGGLPQTRWYVHLTHAIPVEPQPRHLQIFAQLVLSVLPHLRQVHRPEVHILQPLEKQPDLGGVE